MRLNKKGYLTIEIVLASVVAFTIAFFLMEITVNLVNKTNDYYVDVDITTDKALVIKNIKEDIQSDINDSNGWKIESITCSDGSSPSVNSDGNYSCTDNSLKLIYDSSYEYGTLKIVDNVISYVHTSCDSDSNCTEEEIYSKEMNKNLSNIKLSYNYINDSVLNFVIDAENIYSDNDYSMNIPITNYRTPTKVDKVVYTLANYVTKLYTEASKTTVTNNSITYNYATSVSLMNDRLGGTTTDYDGGNIRYYGASPSNYVYFNCSDYDNQTSDTCEKWRIIGVFDGMVKIISSESIGDYSWDSSESEKVDSQHGVNEWSQADIMKLLNSGYESESVGGSLYYNSSSGTCYNTFNNGTTSCDFTSTGLKNSITKNMIEEVTWYLGGTNSDGYSDQFYSYERGTSVVSNPDDGIARTTSWSGEIALMYPSDYGYAADFNKCSVTLSKYYTESDYVCSENDWLNNLHWNWFLTPSSETATYAWETGGGGSVASYFVNITGGILPTLYLKSDIKLSTGTGTSDDPYELLAE